MIEIVKIWMPYLYGKKLLPSSLWKRDPWKSVKLKRSLGVAWYGCYWPLCLTMPQSHFLNAVFCQLEDHTIKNFSGVTKGAHTSDGILRFLPLLYFRQMLFILTFSLLGESVKLIMWWNNLKISVFSLTLILFFYYCTSNSIFFIGLKNFLHAIQFFIPKRCK